MTTPAAAPQSLAGPFRASTPFVRWPGILVLVNIAIIVLALVVHQIPLIALFGMMGLAFLALFLSAVTLRVTMTEDGLRQQWIWGWRTIGWNEVVTIERVRRRFFGDGLFLLNAQNKEIFAVSSLPIAAQETITAEAIKRANLRKDKKPTKPPIVERWVRK